MIRDELQPEAPVTILILPKVLPWKNNHGEI